MTLYSVYYDGNVSIKGSSIDLNHKNDKKKRLQKNATLIINEILKVI